MDTSNQGPQVAAEAEATAGGSDSDTSSSSSSGEASHTVSGNIDRGAVDTPVSSAFAFLEQYLDDDTDTDQQRQVDSAAAATSPFAYSKRDASADTDADASPLQQSHTPTNDDQNYVQQGEQQETDSNFTLEMTPADAPVATQGAAATATATALIPSESSANALQQQMLQSDSVDRSQQAEEIAVPAMSLNRVKLYHLNSTGTWDDMGTGHVLCTYLPHRNTICLVMMSEPQAIAETSAQASATESSNNAEAETTTTGVAAQQERPPPSQHQRRKLLESQVLKDDVYQLQGDSLIVWSDPDSGIDTALSFQESEGCAQLWDQIRVTQGRRPDSHELMTKNMTSDQLVDDFAESGGNASGGGIAIADLNSSTSSTGSTGALYGSGAAGHGARANHNAFELPEPSLGNLQDIVDIFTADSLITKTRLSTHLSQKPWRYIEKLFDVFDEAESLDDADSLYLLFDIFKHIVLLDEHKIFEYLFQEKVFPRLLGVFEYDSELQHISHKNHHRQYFKNRVVYRKVIPFSDPTVENRIHYSFRVSFLKDNVLAKHLDDATHSTLGTMIHFNNLEIIKAIKDDRQFLDRLFGELRQECSKIQAARAGSALQQEIAASSTRRYELIKLLQEYNALLKQVQGYVKDGIYRTLLSHGLLGCIEWLLLDEQSIVRHACTDVLCSIILFDSNGVRQYMLNEYKQAPGGRSQLLESMIHIITDEPELGIQDNLTDTFKTLFDPDHIVVSKEEILNMFYPTRGAGNNAGGVGNGQEAALSPSPSISSVSSPEQPITIIVQSYPGLQLEAQQSPVSDSAPPPTSPEKYIFSLMRPFDRLDYPSDSASMHEEQREVIMSSPFICQAFVHVLDVLGFFVLQHQHRIRAQIVASRLLLKVSNLLAVCSLANRKDVCLSCIKFIRTCIQLQDAVYNDNIVTLNVFRPLMQLWRLNAQRYNLINSSIIELFELIRSKTMKKLIRHSVQTYREDFGKITYVDTFSALIEKYDELENGPPSAMPSPSPSPSASPFLGDKPSLNGMRKTASNVERIMSMRDLDNKWFEEDDEDDGTAAAAHGSKAESSAPAGTGADKISSSIQDSIQFISVAKKDSEDEEEDDEFALFAGASRQQRPASATPIVTHGLSHSSASTGPLANGSHRPGTPIKPKFSFNINLAGAPAAASAADAASPVEPVPFRMDTSADDRIVSADNTAASAPGSKDGEGGSTVGKKRSAGEAQPEEKSSSVESPVAPVSGGDSAFMSESSSADLGLSSLIPDVYKREKDECEPEAKRPRLPAPAEDSSDSGVCTQETVPATEIDTT